jgi:hypothetical protein
MKLHVVFGQNGHILAAAQISGSSSVRVRPRANEKAGERAADILVPDEYRHFDMAAICERLRVDETGRFPDLKLKD